jgi:hypothetical protein
MNKTIKVKITEDKLHAICLNSGKNYLINHKSNNGEDITSLAEIASKTSWFEVDNPQFKPNTIQDAVVLENGRVYIIKWTSSEDIINGNNGY